MQMFLGPSPLPTNSISVSLVLLFFELIWKFLFFQFVLKHAVASRFISPGGVEAREVLKMVQGSPFLAGDILVGTKPALSKLNGARNWALREAETLVKVSPAAKEEIKIDWTGRSVKHGTEIAFQQKKDDVKGSFIGVFADLMLK